MKIERNEWKAGAAGELSVIRDGWCLSVRPRAVLDNETFDRAYLIYQCTITPPDGTYHAFSSNENSCEKAIEATCRQFNYLHDIKE